MISMDVAKFDNALDWIFLGMAVFCILCAALAAGLTIGLVSIDHKELQLMMINGSEEEKAQARRILPLISDHHWLLVTLFLFNAIANESLPIFISRLLPEYAAVVISAFSVLLFGEILPSSIFSGRNQLRIAASLAPVVKGLMALFYVVARPIGLCLDSWLGKHDENSAPFNAKDLYTLLSLSGQRSPNHQTQQQQHDDSITSPLAPSFERAPSLLSSQDGSSLLHHDSVTIAQGAIVCSRRTVPSIAQSAYFTVLSTDVVTVEWLQAVGKTGYSRVLVHEQEAGVYRYFVVKELLAHLGQYLAVPPLVSHLPLYPIQYFHQSASILDALNVLQSGVSRLGAVSSDGTPRGAIIGYFSMEDIVEAIIQEEISDEKDSRHNAHFLAMLQGKNIELK